MLSIVRIKKRPLSPCNFDRISHFGRLAIIASAFLLCRDCAVVSGPLSIPTRRLILLDAPCDGFHTLRPGGDV